MKSSPLRQAIFLSPTSMGQSDQLVADLMQARVQAKGAEDRAWMLQAWQLWFDAVFEDRNQAQVVMENQFDQLQSLAAALEQIQTPSYMEKKWSAQILRDPYYSPNLSLHSRGFDLAFPPRWENEAAITEAD